MALISSTQLFKKAKEEKYAVPAFNFENMEMAKGIIEACREENSPVIMQTTTSTLKYIAPEIAYKIVEYYAKEYNIDVVLHLDHGASYEPVSYTHLDVYKRQLYHRLRFRSSCVICHEKRKFCEDNKR